MDHTFARGIDLFNHREFFECHEEIEAVWVGTRGARRFFLQAIIHIAVGFYHQRQGNALGARLQLGKGLRKLAGYLPSCENIDTARLYSETLLQLERIEDGVEGIEYPKITIQSH